MRLSVEHRITCRFGIPVPRLTHMLRLTPQNSHDQTVTRWRIDVDCDARLREMRDGWGNVVTMLYAEGPLEALEIAVTGDVLTSHSDGVLHGVHETLPPQVFGRSTPLTAPDAAIHDWARDLSQEKPALAALHRINAALKARGGVDDTLADEGLTAGAAWRRDRWTARDAAHIFLVAARSLGVPARYVSGYRVTAGEAARPHGWCEAHVTGLGWVGFDPATGLSPQADHVRMAVALDAIGAAPVAGGAGARRSMSVLVSES